MIVTAGIDTDITSAQAKLTPDASWIKTADGVKVEITNPPSAMQGGEEVDLLIRFTDAANEALSDSHPPSLNRRIRMSAGVCPKTCR